MTAQPQITIHPHAQLEVTQRTGQHTRITGHVQEHAGGAGLRHPQGHRRARRQRKLAAHFHVQAGQRTAGIQQDIIAITQHHIVVAAGVKYIHLTKIVLCIVQHHVMGRGQVTGTCRLDHSAATNTAAAGQEQVRGLHIAQLQIKTTVEDFYRAGGRDIHRAGKLGMIKINHVADQRHFPIDAETAQAVLQWLGFHQRTGADVGRFHMQAAHMVGQRCRQADPVTVYRCFSGKIHMPGLQGQLAVNGKRADDQRITGDQRYILFGHPANHTQLVGAVIQHHTAVLGKKPVQPAAGHHIMADDIATGKQRKTVRRHSTQVQRAVITQLQYTAGIHADQPVKAVMVTEQAACAVVTHTQQHRTTGLQCAIAANTQVACLLQVTTGHRHGKIAARSQAAQGQAIDGVQHNRTAGSQPGCICRCQVIKIVTGLVKHDVAIGIHQGTAIQGQGGTCLLGDIPGGCQAQITVCRVLLEIKTMADISKQQVIAVDDLHIAPVVAIRPVNAANRQCSAKVTGGHNVTIGDQLCRTGHIGGNQVYAGTAGVDNLRITAGRQAKQVQAITDAAISTITHIVAMQLYSLHDQGCCLAKINITSGSDLQQTALDQCIAGCRDGARCINRQQGWQAEYRGKFAAQTLDMQVTQRLQADITGQVGTQAAATDIHPQRVGQPTHIG